MNVSNIQQERTKYYGDYIDNISFRCEVMDIIKRYNNLAVTKHGSPSLTDKQIMILNDIVSKLARLASTPTHDDSGIDCESYMNLYNKLNGFYNES